MDRIGYDSDVIASIPASAAVALTYSDLVADLHALGQLQARWPVVVLIDRGLGDPTGRASVLDIERGAASIRQAPGWFDEREKAGIRWPTIYVNRANLAAVDVAMGARGVYRWIATLDGTMTVPEHPGAMVQFAPASEPGHAGTGRHADATIIRNDAWHPLPDPARVRARSGLMRAQEALTAALRDI